MVAVPISSGIAFELAVALRALAHPRLQNRLDRGPELSERRGGERFTGYRLEESLEARDELAKRLAIELIRLGKLLLGELCCQNPFEGCRLGVMDDLGELLDQAAATVGGEARVAREPEQTPRRRFREPDVEDRLHHARHRHRGSRAHGDEEGMLRFAEAASGAGGERFELVLQKLVEPLERGLAMLEIGPAKPGAQDKAGRHDEPAPRHAH